MLSVSLASSIAQEIYLFFYLKGNSFQNKTLQKELGALALMVHLFCGFSKAARRQKEVINQVNGNLINGIILADVGTL